MLLKFWYWLTKIETCKNCEYLRDLLYDERNAKEQLLKVVIESSRSKEVIKEEPKLDIKPILPREIPWRVRKEMLEAEDRKQAEILRELSSSDTSTISNLEKELGISDAS